MAFGNARRILQAVSGLSALKLLLLMARFTRPKLEPLCTLLLQPFIRNGEIPIRYREGNRNYSASIRTSDLQSDLHSTLEVIVRKVYALDPVFAPDLVIDGGANIGLFSLQAAATYPAAKIVMCEPLPRNIAQARKLLSINHVAADLLPVCIGGTHRTIPFYCRSANDSSFDDNEPYLSVLEIEVLRLRDIAESKTAKRLLIKLDIEGMEMESLQDYVPTESRSVTILGELHRHRETRPVMEALFTGHGWSFEVGDLSGDDTIFEAHSPAARALRLDEVSTRMVAGG
jgi:FkbM family methyltransferase